MDQQDKKGQLFIISAPSGTGKSTIIQRFLKNFHEAQFYMSISHTTRPVRPGEEDGVHYFFVDIDCFQELLEKDEFLEYAEVFGNFYGTSKRIIAEKLAQGVNIILDIDWQGARNVRKAFPEANSIFLLPPSIDELKQRLLMRNTDSLDVIDRRMSKAMSEISHQNEYDHIIVNDQLDVAYNEFVDYIKSKIF